MDVRDGQARSALQKLAPCLYSRVLRVLGCTMPVQESAQGTGLHCAIAGIFG